MADSNKHGRNDAALWTAMGATSDTQIRRQKQREMHEKRNAERVELLPAADIVLQTIAEEKRGVELALLKQIKIGTKEPDVKAAIVALNMYDQSLDSLKTKLQNKLRDNKVKRNHDEQ